MCLPAGVSTVIAVKRSDGAISDATVRNAAVRSKQLGSRGKRRRRWYTSHLIESTVRAPSSSACGSACSHSTTRSRVPSSAASAAASGVRAHAATSAIMRERQAVSFGGGTMLMASPSAWAPPVPRAPASERHCP